MNVGIVSPGDMGCRMAGALIQGGVTVRASLAGLPGVTLVPVDGPVGAASALKMCWSATSKGLQALWLESLVGAEGAAEVFRMVASSPIGSGRPETLDRSRDVWATVGAVAKHAAGRS